MWLYNLLWQISNDLTYLFANVFFSLGKRVQQIVVSNFLGKKKKQKRIPCSSHAVGNRKKYCNDLTCICLPIAFFSWVTRVQQSGVLVFLEKKIPCSNHTICSSSNNNNKSIAMILHCIFVCELRLFLLKDSNKVLFEVLEKKIPCSNHTFCNKKKSILKNFKS